MKNKTIEKKPNLITELTAHLNPAKSFIESNLIKYLVNFEDVVQLIKKSSGKNSEIKKSIAASFNKDTEALVELLDKTHQLIKDSGTKNKITRLKKALQSTDSFESDSDSTTKCR